MTALVTNRQLELAKWIAIITMVIDHIGDIFYPTEMQWRLIGRFAFPLFCWIIAVRLAEKPERASSYLPRLIAWTLISQFPFWLAFHPKDSFFDTLNIMATLGLGVGITALLHKMVKCQINQPLGWLAITALLIAGGRCDYGTMGVVIIPLTVWAARQSALKSATVVGLAAGAANFSIVLPWLMKQPDYALALAGCAFLGGSVAKACLLTNIPLPRLPRWFFYAFYPAHLALIIAYVISITPQTH